MDDSASSATKLLSKSGRRRNGLSEGVGPPSTMWLPPPVPVWRPSSMNFSVPRRLSRACAYRVGGVRDELAPASRGLDVDLGHARVGCDLNLLGADRRAEDNASTRTGW